MIEHNKAADPKVHELAVAIARRCVYIIQAILREEERGDALREFYLVAREEIERDAAARGTAARAAKAT